MMTDTDLWKPRMKPRAAGGAAPPPLASITCLVCTRTAMVDVRTNDALICDVCRADVPGRLDALERLIVAAEEQLQDVWETFTAVLEGATSIDQGRYGRVCETLGRLRVGPEANDPALHDKTLARLAEARARGDGLSTILVAEDALWDVVRHAEAQLERLGVAQRELAILPGADAWQPPADVLASRQALAARQSRPQLASVATLPRAGEYQVPDGASVEACHSCGAQIVWVSSKKRPLPLSVATIVRRDGVAWALSHFVDCPDAKEWKRS